MMTPNDGNPSITGPQRFRVEYDPEASASYIYLEGYDKNHARTTTPGADEGVMLDFNAEGFVTGIELIGFKPSDEIEGLRAALQRIARLGEQWPAGQECREVAQEALRE